MSLSTIEASDEAVKRRKAEYIILKHLHDFGPAHCDAIDGQIHEIHLDLLQEEAESPFLFRLGGSNGPESRQIDESLERLRHFGKIEMTPERNYELNEEGRVYLENSDALRRDGIDETFETVVENTLE